MDSIVFVAASFALDDILVAENGFQRPELTLDERYMSEKKWLDRRKIGPGLKETSDLNT